MIGGWYRPALELVLELVLDQCVDVDVIDDDGSNANGGQRDRFHGRRKPRIADIGAGWNEGLRN
jgi:hypothetical protein